MKINFELEGVEYSSDTSEGVSLGIQVDFDGPQPNHFGAPKASRSPLKLGGFVGDTTQGGSCNVDAIEMVPHCNGTHTESIGHIVDPEVPIGLNQLNALTTATLLHVEAEPFSDVRESLGESYRPALQEPDWVVSAKQLEFALHSIDLPLTTSLIVTSHDNESAKSRSYNEENQPPFFTIEAMKLIVSKKFQHLLVSFPSVDRMYDDGLLTNHHLYWNVQEGTHELTEDCWDEKTITEMIYVPESVESGLYLLNLQVPGFNADAAPSRPIIYKANRKKA
jgi:kynurenine formamidase